MPLRYVLHERRRKTEVEPPRAHPHRARDEEVAGLVEEDEHREAEDREERCSCDLHCSFGEPPCGLVGGRRAHRDRARARRPPRRGVRDDVGDAEERQPSVEERGDRDLVRGVEHAGSVPPCSPALRACASSGNVSRSGRLELEGQARREVERRKRRARRAPDRSARTRSARACPGSPRCASAAPSRKRTSA